MKIPSSTKRKPAQRRHLLSSWLPILIAPILIAGLPSGAQQSPSETLKVEATDVVVDVIVTDKNGHHVPGLTARDFSIVEDGVPQKIASFSEARSPKPAADDKISPPAPQKAANTPAAPARPHLLTVVMDLADSRPDNLRKSADAVVNYLEKKLGTDDYVAIYYIDRTLRLGLPFTNDLAQARAALAKLGSSTTAVDSSASDRTLLQNQINELFARIHRESLVGTATEAVASRENPQVLLLQQELNTLRAYLTTQNTLQAKAVFMALRAVCLSYRDLPGRKNVVLFSEGFLYADDARPQMEAVADAANRSNVALYVIDPVGLEISGGVLGQGPDTSFSRMADIAAEGPAPVGQAHAETKFDKMRSLEDSTRNEQLQWLADVTGGLMVKNRNDLGAAFSGAIDDARDFYSISYQPANKDFNGKFRKIKLDLAQNGYKLRYRQGYWAIPHGQAVAMSPAAVQMLAAVTSSAYRPAFTPELYANLLLAPDGTFVVPVSVSFSGGKVPLEKITDGFKSDVTLVLVARDANGMIVATRQRNWPVQINKKNEDEFLQKTLTLQTDVRVNKLEPLTLEGIVSLPGGILASSKTELKVTEPSAAGPYLSSVLLTDRAEQASCPDNSDPLCLTDMRLIQPAKPQFVPNSRLIVYFLANGLVLDESTKQPRIGVDLRLRSANAALKSPAAENVQALPGPIPGSVMVMGQFDLRSLSQGSYSLQVTARDIVKKTSAKSETVFTIQ
jgi:VWFA-related protein